MAKRQLTSATVLSLICSTLGSRWETWVSYFSKKLLWGMDSLGCLGFLHGKTGTIKKEADPPGWLVSLTKRWVSQKAGTKRNRKVLNLNGTSCLKASILSIDWSNGKISWLENDREKTMKLGKWLRKAGATPEQLHEFETRKLSEWRWEISSDLLDILTMSHNRSWTSCMRPDGAYQKGLFTDMRAGSAVLFWYRPGADKPCGREILRPAVFDGEPFIIRGGTVYGDGPEISDEELSSLLEIPCRFTSLYGEETFSLRKDIYSDFDKDGYSQTKESIKEAEEALLKGFCPLLTPKPYPYSSFSFPIQKKRKIDSSWTSKQEVRKIEGKISTLKNMLRGTHFSWRTLQYEEWERTGMEREVILERIEELRADLIIAMNSFLRDCKSIEEAYSL
jgi:hypothetical protein